ncbi:MAG: flagellar basal-body rod protein FlgG [Clostridiales bacterium]|nr:flagellar basal-body rod protein FlgG [Clostridiales bacterium]
MMRSLWTGASGMMSQQINVDTIANNLSNINTTGFKTQRAEFKTLLYQTIQEKSTDTNGEDKPIGIQVGLGTRNSAITSQYTQGTLTETGNQWDFAIEGNGFFALQMMDGSIGYTRSGAFQMSIGVGGNTLSDSDGNPVLDSTGAPITIDSTYSPAEVTVDAAGNLYYPDDSGNAQAMGIQIGLVQFNNPSGLEKGSGTLLKESVSSGTPRWESADAALEKSDIRQKYLESSNVQAVDEMVNLIVAQRAYEMNSKIISASDTMLQQANNLRS